MSITFRELAKQVLSEVDKPLTPKEIWKYAAEKGYHRQVNSKGKTPWSTLSSTLYTELKNNPETEFSLVGVQPKRYSLRTKRDATGETSADYEAGRTFVKPSFNECQLHPFLVYYGYHHLGAQLRTINHTRSRKTIYGEWVHPDVVGCYFPFSKWRSEVVELSTLLKNTAVKLFSFEIKRELTIGNLREAYFQAVSNSSWAHEGYLVTAYVDDLDDLKYELTRLVAAFGIGVIHLNIEDPDSSSLVHPARVRNSVDLETVNKLASMNPDFSDYLKHIKDGMSIRKVIRENFDPVLSREELSRLAGVILDSSRGSPVAS